jgi:orotidine-5'-phosphate decarboxylase
VDDLAPAFQPGRAGGLVTASRSIAGAHVLAGGEPAAAARAEAERLRGAAWALADLVLGAS